MGRVVSKIGRGRESGGEEKVEEKIRGGRKDGRRKGETVCTHRCELVAGQQYVSRERNREDFFFNFRLTYSKGRRESERDTTKRDFQSSRGIRH